MKTKIILAVFIGLLLGHVAVTFPVVVCTPFGTTTTNFGLCKPADSEVGWGAAYRASMDIIDTQMGSPSFTGKILKYNNLAPTDGQLLIGGTSAAAFSAATLTAGTGITITNGNGTITITGLAGMFSGEFISSDQAVTFSSVLTVAHGLGAKPKLVQVVLKCATGEGGFSVGDEIMVMGTTTEVNAADRTSGVAWDATNVVINTGSTYQAYTKGSAGASFALTAANWKYVVRAWK